MQTKTSDSLGYSIPKDVKRDAYVIIRNTLLRFVAI